MSTDITTPSTRAYTGRIVAIVSLLVGLVGAAAPVALNLDISSTAGIAAGIVALSAVTVKYLDGWQKYEARLDAVPTQQPDDSNVSGEPGQGTAPRSRTLPVSTPNAGRTNGAGAADPPAVDPDEPAAPAPGEVDAPPVLVPGDELPDIPDPPTDDEIANANGDVLVGAPPARRT